jgi:hypothetical protein
LLDTTRAKPWVVAGHIAEGLATVGEAIEHCERKEERWTIADLLAHQR